MERCNTCQYYDRQNKGQAVGQCRRQAPALSPINVKAYMIEGVWPTVRDDDWCGEFRAQARRAELRPGDSVGNVMSRLAPQATPPLPASRVSTLPVPLPMPSTPAIGGLNGSD